MKLPTFLIIGAPKAGTTSLYHYLAQHPDIYMSANKEPHYFAFPSGAPGYTGPGDATAPLNTGSVCELDTYRQLFAPAAPHQARGEASTRYLQLKPSRDAIAALVPDIKLIAVLRNPVDRAYANYRHMRRDGREWETFERALLAEARRTADGWAPSWAYQEGGYYYRQLSYYLERFDRQQLKVYLFDELLNDPQAVFTDIFRFIGVDPDFVVDATVKHNASTQAPASKALNDLLVKESWLKATLRRFLPADFRKQLSVKIYRRNVKKIAPLSDSTRTVLTAMYAQDIKQLEQLLDRPLNHWLNNSSIES